MKTNTLAPNYKGFRFPPEIISHAVWLYFRFSLSFRDVGELLAQRGIVVTYSVSFMLVVYYNFETSSKFERTVRCKNIEKTKKERLPHTYRQN